MSTRSSARRLLSPIEDPEKLISRRNRSEPSLLFDLEEDDMAGQAPPQGPIPDLRSMEELLQAPTDGVGDAIVNDDPHSHIRRFTKITQTVKLNQVPPDVIKLMLFPFSLEGAARTWLDKEPLNSITTWNDLVSKFVNHFFPPSKTTNLRNEIMRFQQRFGETFAEAWDRFKDLLNKCPHHGFSPLHQVDTFYNSLSQADQDSLNSAAGVQTSRNKPQVASASESSAQDAHISSPTKQSESLLALHRPVDSAQIKLILFKTVVRRVVVLTLTSSVKPPVATLRTYTLLREPITKVVILTNHKNQAQSNVPSFEEIMNQHMKMTKARMQQMKEYNNLQLQQLKNHNTNMSNKIDQMQKVLMERPQGVLPSNTVPNPREDLKAITTRSGVTLVGPSVPPPPISSSKEVDREPKTITYPVLTESTTSVPPPVVQSSPASTELLHAPVSSPVTLERMRDTRRFLIPCDFYGLESCMALANLGASINLMPLSAWKTLSLPDLSSTRMTLELATRTVAYPTSIAEDVFVQVGKFTFQAEFVVVDYEVDSRVPLILGRPFLRMAQALVDVHGEKLTLRVGDEELVFNVESTRILESMGDGISIRLTLLILHARIISMRC
ncbi:reverse transcriptase domain-containing protein [Tanacetum coccineum]